MAAVYLGASITPDSGSSFQRQKGVAQQCHVEGKTEKKKHILYEF